MPIELIPLVFFAIAQIGTPGPANMVLLATGAGYGLRRTLPFVAGVIVGKQIIIWPLGFGLMHLAQSWPVLFFIMKYLSAAYIIYLAWRVANMRLNSKQGEGSAPGFIAGLIVHPLNPKAWGMITASFTSFVIPGSDIFLTTLSVAVVLISCQTILHPIWAGVGQLIAKTIQGTRAERGVFVILALITLITVFYALFGGLI